MKIHLALAFITIYFFLIGCTRDRSVKKYIEKKISIDSSKFYNCNCCVLDSFLIRPAKTSVSHIIINTPVAIGFFNRLSLINKYQNNTSYDTLMKIFKMKNSGDRNIIYALTEQHYFFEKEIMPKLSARSISVIDTIRKSQVITLQSKNTSYTVDLKKYYDYDGVLMFNPGKAPIFWTLKNEEKYCNELAGLVQQYYDCP